MKRIKEIEARYCLEPGHIKPFTVEGMDMSYLLEKLKRAVEVIEFYENGEASYDDGARARDFLKEVQDE